MPLPISLTKAVGDDVPLRHDWSDELQLLGLTEATIIESNWSVEYGTVVLAARVRPNLIDGTTTTTHVSGGTAREYAIVNNSIVLDTGDELVARLKVRVIEGDYVP
jgi:hypothetical protein